MATITTTRDGTGIFYRTGARGSWWCSVSMAREN
jgi:hypothetical protein